MNKIIFVGILILSIITLVSCERKNSSQESGDDTTKFSHRDVQPKRNHSSKENFIYVEDYKFKQNGEVFYPIMLNYVVDLRDIDNEAVISPVMYYEKTDEYEYETKEETYEQLSRHFKFIRSMGFNSIRLVFDRMIIEPSTGNHKYQNISGRAFTMDEQLDEIVASLEKVVSIAKANDLYVMLLLQPCMGDEFIDAFTKLTLNAFSDEPYVFAYDFMNEPLYTDKKKFRPKGEAVKITREWRNIMNEYAPNQLFTVGSSEPLEVFEWDPSLIDVDFIQIHTYHPLRVKNEIYWYSKYVNRPWMIGETSLPADNDSISYDEQRQFVKETYQYARDCGCMGFGFWEFQDNPNSPEFEGKYTGLMNHNGTTILDDGTTIIGTAKSTAKEFKNLKNYTPQKVTQPPVNYKNMIGLYNIKITGWVYDHATSLPLEGAVFRAWTDDWGIGINTYTDENGEFTLYTNDIVTHFECSACGMSNFCMTKNLTYTPATSENYDINNLPEKWLDYHHRSYTPLLKDGIKLTENSTNYIFNFEEEKFRQFKFTSDFGLFVIEKMPICD
ncbi:MAG: cellulase family glycosylhydrolase [Bacteroidales bacterium]|nr:cellulase family glycosylhydrolase [Bacteroidales bacterium]